MGQPTADQLAATYANDAALGLPQGTTARQIGVESSWNAGAVSPRGAMGYVQVMPKTLDTISQRLGRPLDPSNFSDALAIQKAVMGENLAKFGNAPDALRAYNSGWNKSAWNNPETNNYVAQITGGQAPQAAQRGGSSGGAAPQYASYANTPTNLGVGGTMRNYANSVLGFLTGSTSAQAGELTPAQRAYGNATNGPSPPPSAPKPATASGASAGQGNANADPFADLNSKFSPTPTGGSKATPADPFADLNAQFAPPTAAAPAAAPQAGASAPAAPMAPANAPASAPAAQPQQSATPQAQPGLLQRAGDWLGNQWDSLKQGAENVGMIQAGLADQIDPKTLPTLDSSKAPPAAPTDRGFVGDMGNAFLHHVENPVVAAGQKGLALASGLSHAYDWLDPGISQRTGQAAQALNDIATNREKFYQADQANGVGTAIGAFGGDLAPALLLGPMGTGLGGATATGAVGASMQPVLNAQGAGDVAKGSAIQAGVGGLLGGGLYGVGKGLGYLYNQGRETTSSLWDAVTRSRALGSEAGQTEAAGDIIGSKLTPQSTQTGARVASKLDIPTDAAPPNMGPQLPGVPNAPLVVPESDIPGVSRSLAERTMNPQVAQLHRSLRDMPGVNDPILQLEAQNATARNNFFNGIIGDDASLTSLRAARDDATNALYDQADAAVLPYDADLQRMLVETSQGRRALADAQDIWSNNPETWDTPLIGGTEEAPTLTGRALKTIKKSFDGIVNNNMSSDNPELRRATSGLRERFMGWAADRNPVYAQANAEYAARSAPINEQEYLQTLGVRATDKQDNVTLGKIDNLVRRITTDRMNASPTDPVNSVSDTSLTALGRLRHDMQISDAAFDLGKAKGSETAQKQVQNYALANLSPTARVAMEAALKGGGKGAGMAAGGALGGPVGAGLGMAIGSVADARMGESVLANQQGLLAQLGEQLANPQSIAQITRGASARQAAAHRAKAAQQAAQAAATRSPNTAAALARMGLLGYLGRAAGS